jgi:hypothetical protein
VAFSLDDRLLASALRDRTIMLWDIGTKEMTWTINVEGFIGELSLKGADVNDSQLKCTSLCFCLYQLT